MAALHLPPPGGGGGGVDGINPAGPPAPPGTDMTGICFRDQLWLNSFPLERNLVFDYFALSPFYDFSCNNEKLRMQSIHPLDISHISKLTGMEYTLSEVLEPHLFVIRKQKRDGPERVTPMLTYYILDGSIYQAPQLSNVFASRIARALYHMSKAFSMASSKLEKIGNVDLEDDGASIGAKPVKELFDFKEVKRGDQILGSLLRKLPPAPAPPPFPEDYAPAQTTETENGTETQLSSDGLPKDPVIDQGPAKRPRLDK